MSWSRKGLREPLWCGVYQIRNVQNGKVYVGSSVELPVRWEQHKANLRKGKHHNPHLQNAWRLYGESSFMFEVLVSGVLPDTLPRLEGHFCSVLNVFDRDTGYNVAGVDESGSHFKTAEHRRKIGDAHRGKKRGPLSPDTKAKLSAIRRVQRLGVGNPAFGKPAHNRRSVSQIGLDGVEVRVWSSLREAAEFHGVSSDAIAQAAKGKGRTSQGFVWQYVVGT